MHVQLQIAVSYTAASPLSILSLQILTAIYPGIGSSEPQQVSYSANASSDSSRLIPTSLVYSARFSHSIWHILHTRSMLHPCLHCSGLCCVTGYRRRRRGGSAPTRPLPSATITGHREPRVRGGAQPSSLRHGGSLVRTVRCSVAD